MSYRDPYAEPPGRLQQQQPRYSEAEYNPYSTSAPHQSYDQGGIAPSYDNYGAGYRDDDYEQRLPPQRAQSQRTPYATNADLASKEINRTETAGVVREPSILLTLALFIRPPNIAIGDVSTLSKGGSAIQLIENGIQVNLGVNISVNNPNYFAVNFKEIKAQIFYPINGQAPQLGEGSSKDVVFSAHQLTNWTFPFAIQYKTTDDPQGLILQDLASKCGVGGPKSNIKVNYKITLGLRILFITVSPVVQNSLNFICPLNPSDLEVSLASQCHNKDLTQLIPPDSLGEKDKAIVFDHLLCRLAVSRNTSELYADTEYALSTLPGNEAVRRRDEFENEIEHWAQGLLQHAWAVCHDSEGDRPVLDKHKDTSIRNLPKLPHAEDLTKILNSILFLHLTTSKQYSARTRSFLSTFGSLDEETIVCTLKNHERAIEEAQAKAKATTADHAERGKVFRAVGMGFGAVAGGVLIGVTGGLAAPLVGTGVAAVLGWLGVGGTAVGLLASGLAGSSVVCGALFGVYGARSTASMVERHTREIRDLALVPVRDIRGDETLGVRLCVSGWLSSIKDVKAPWTVFSGDNTYALQWEVEALEELSSALVTLLKSHAMKYVKAEVIKRTILASLMSSLAPIALLKIGQIIDNPWMNAKALAAKAGAVLGELLAQRMFGSRPVTLAGYSLGSLVIFEALKHLASLPPSETAHLIQDAYLFGTPAPADAQTWSGIRRLVSGRLVNGYSTNDYVLAVLSRPSSASWQVAGLQSVDVMGVENVLCESVDGHTMWRGMIGKCLRDCQAPGIIPDEAGLQMTAVAMPEAKENAMSPEEAEGRVSGSI
ncbi:hypothetical protein DXG03_000794 [Asterophora parasitica]|uniref:DUF726-domain-containing protein n=1 Tax=Asterophora parasitica TaxID=117018 RepID=A0A9P7GB45_9AGAR|nr:hypothetical protein DXG03_000794 [Asterophora parasitica]